LKFNFKFMENKQAQDERTKLKLSTLWIVIMINMVFADILGFVIQFVEGDVISIPGDVGTTMLIAAIVTQIPIWMIFLSRFLKQKLNRTLNMIAAILTAIYVIAGGELAPHYIFIAFVEVACMVYIFRTSLRWRES
jgi:hypothetical protein